MKDILTNLDYWIKEQGSPKISLDKNNIIKEFIDKNVDYSEIKTAFEIGCYPGKFLTIPGDKGVEVSGIDYIPQVTQLKDIFLKQGYKVGEFIQGDFLDFSSKKKYDCVMSFGFIEHFKNWEEVMRKHFDLVADNGLVIIEVPNFRGFFQKLPRYLFDYKNFKRHNLNAMELKSWQKVLESNGFEIIHSGYFGGNQLWFEKRYRNRIINLSKKMVLRVLNKIQKLVYRDKENDKKFSCVLGIIAKKI